MVRARYHRSRSWSVVLPAGAALALLVGCSSPPRGLPDQRPTVTGTAALAHCAASARVPSTAVNAVPSRGTPATVVLAVGDAVALAAPTASRVRAFAGSSTRAATRELCIGSARPGTTTLLAEQPGYVRIAVSSGDTQRLLYVKITS